MQEHCNGIFTYENDKMMSLIQKESTLEDINAHLAANISNFVSLNDLPKLGRLYSTVASECVLSPELNYLSLFSAQAKQSEDMHSLLAEQLRNHQHDAYS